MYSDTSNTGWEQSNLFKHVFSIDVQIQFIGVWYAFSFALYRIIQANPFEPIRDTVDSVGLIPRRLPFTTSNTIVRTFRHAVSLDERRAYFKANLWNRPTVKEVKLGVSNTKTPVVPPLNKGVDLNALEEEDNDGNDALEANESRYSMTEKDPTDIYEVWFSGCHCGEHYSTLILFYS
jgi:uncharacterized protein (DUF2235 family)